KTPAHMINTAFADLPQATASVAKNEDVAAVPSIMFNERFAAAAADSVAPSASGNVQLVSVSPSVEVSLPAEPAKKIRASASVQTAMATPTRSVERVTGKSGNSIRDMAQRAKAAVMSIGQDKPSMVEKLWGKEPSHGALLAYAFADVSITGSIAKE